MIVLLHNIRSCQNVGSIFRTADAIGVEKLYLCGITPTPLDRFGKKRTDVTKASLGAEDSIAWEKIGSTLDTRALIAQIKKLKKDGHTILALEQHTNSKELFSYATKYTNKTALIVGNEVEGISPSVLKYTDTILEIPMHGKKESLNVAVAFGIAGYYLTKH